MKNFHLNRTSCGAGGSAIVGPLGEYIIEPVYGREEVLYAELDLDLSLKVDLILIQSRVMLARIYYN